MGFAEGDQRSEKMYTRHNEGVDDDKRSKMEGGKKVRPVAHFLGNPV